MGGAETEVGTSATLAGAVLVREVLVGLGLDVERGVAVLGGDSATSTTRVSLFGTDGVRGYVLVSPARPLRGGVARPDLVEVTSSLRALANDYLAVFAPTLRALTTDGVRSAYATASNADVERVLELVGPGGPTSEDLRVLASARSLVGASVVEGLSSPWRARAEAVALALGFLAAVRGGAPSEWALRRLEGAP